MIAAREERDADRVENYVKYTEHPTQTNSQEIVCGTCAKAFYVDEQTFHDLSRAIEFDIDNQFVCDDCVEEFHRQAYDDR
jgi:hypothetical protein